MVPVDELSAALPRLPRTEDPCGCEDHAFTTLGLLDQAVVVEHARHPAVGRKGAFERFIRLQRIARGGVRFIVMFVHDKAHVHDAVPPRTDTDHRPSVGLKADGLDGVGHNQVVLPAYFSFNRKRLFATVNRAENNLRRTADFLERYDF